MAGLGLLLTVHAACWLLLSKSAMPVYAPLEKGGQLISGGEDLDQKGGVIEYTWDMLYVTLFVQLTTGFISDWFWLLYTVRDPARRRCFVLRPAPHAPRLVLRAPRLVLHASYFAPRFASPRVPRRCYCCSFTRSRAPSQIPPCIGLYYLWIKVIYPWISKPDEEPGQQPMEQKNKVKYGKAR